MQIELRVKFDGDELVLGHLGGIDKTQIAAGAAEHPVVRREEKRHAVPVRARIDVGDGESELRGEGSGDVGFRVKEPNWVVVDDGAGAGGGDRELAGEANDAVSDVGVAKKGKVSEVERGEVEVDVLGRATVEEEGYEEEDDDPENKQLSWSHGCGDFEFRWLETNGFWIFFAKAEDLQIMIENMERERERER